MKRILYAVMALCMAFSVNAQDARQRTVSTIVQDVLAQMPAQNKEDFNREIKDLAQSGEEAVVILGSMLTPPSEGANNKIEYAINAVVNYATDPENSQYLPGVRSGLAKAIESCNFVEGKAFLISQLQLCSTSEDLVVFLKYVNDKDLASPAINAILNTPGSESSIMHLVRNDGADRLLLAYAVSFKQISDAEPYLQTWIKEADNDVQKNIYYGALAMCGTKASLNILKKGSTQSYITLLKRIAASGDVKTAESKAKSLLKSDKSNIRSAGIEILINAQGKECTKSLLSALTSEDKAFRNVALKTAAPYADDALFASVAGIYPKLSDDAKEDVLNWFGCNEAKSQAELVVSAMKEGGKVSLAAIAAAGVIGGDKAKEALFANLSGQNSAPSYKALLSFDGDITNEVISVLKGNDATAQVKALGLARARRISKSSPIIFSLLSSENTEVRAAAYTALAGVVTSSDTDKIAAMMEKCDGKYLADVQAAFTSSMTTLSSEDAFAKVSSLMSASEVPYKYYPVIAGVGSDDAVKTLVKEYETGKYQDKALAELLKIDNFTAADYLMKIASEGKGNINAILSRYVALVSKATISQAQKSKKYTAVLSLNPDNKLKEKVLNAMGGLAVAEAFEVAAKYIDEKELAYPASIAAKNIASKCPYDIDYNSLMKPALTKAITVLQATGNPDDGYAVDEIKKLLNEIKPAPKFVLPEDEAAQGFEVLFDGTNLDKWTGDKVGYKVVNGAIAVSANYGASGNLYTIEEYRDFVLRFEFCFVKPGVNNGVGIRTPMGVDAAYEGMCEIQILDHDDPVYKNLREYQVHGSIYGIVPAKRIVHKPLGEWSTEEIRVKGDRITVTVNGEVIVDANVREACKGHNVAPDGSNKNPYTADHKNHPGMFNKKGHIGFLGHGPGIKLRNVRVLNLDK